MYPPYTLPFAKMYINNSENLTPGVNQFPHVSSAETETHNHFCHKSAQPFDLPGFSRQKSDCLNMRIIVQTQAHIFRNDWELEFDGLEPLTVGLPFLINLDFGKQRFHKLPLFLIVHDGIELIKVNQHLVDVVARQLFRLNRHLLGSGGNELVFCILDLIIHLVKPVIKVCFAFDVVLIVRIEGINFIHQPCLY